MSIYDLRTGAIQWSGIGAGNAIPCESAEERNKRMTEYELEQQRSAKLRHEAEMAKERQEQDYNLAMRARLVVGWIVGAGLVTFLVCASFVACYWMSYRR